MSLSNGIEVFRPRGLKTCIYHPCTHSHEQTALIHSPVSFNPFFLPSDESWSVCFSFISFRLRAMHSRMERPYEGQKWDRPLFHCHVDDPTPCEDILHYCLSEGSDLRPSAATQPQRLADSNFLHILDATTQEISREILIAQERGMAGDKAKMPHSAAELISFSPSSSHWHTHNTHPFEQHFEWYIVIRCFLSSDTIVLDFLNRA
jgi:hypothetical protein